MKIARPYAVFIDEICASHKSRCCMESPPSLAVLQFIPFCEQAVKQRWAVEQLYIRVQLLNDKFFYGKTPMFFVKQKSETF